MEEKKLRQYDFITSLGLLIFGLWELSQALKMPMKDSYGGVQSVWYVSPALMPLFVGGGILVLGTILLLHSIRKGGAASFIQSVKHASEMKLTTKTKRILTVLLGFSTLIYLFIPHVDFYLSLTLFLSFICSAFYADSEEFRSSLTRRYFSGSLLFVLLIVTGFDKVLMGIFKYNLDILALMFLIYINIYSGKKGRRLSIDRKIFRQVTLVSLLVPLILCPLFRYFLLVPLPVEGGIIKLMNLAYYAIR